MEKFRVLPKPVEDPMGCLNSIWQDFVINYQLLFLPSLKDEKNVFRSRRVKRVIGAKTLETKEEEIDDEDKRIIRIARILFISLITIIVLIVASVYFYWGIMLSYDFTLYLLGRDAWNFDTGPFAGIRRPTPLMRPRIK